MKLADYRAMAPIHETRFASDDVKLYVTHHKGAGWRVIAEQDDWAATVGPLYKTKFEVFVALPEYAKQWGF